MSYLAAIANLCGAAGILRCVHCAEALHSILEVSDMQSFMMLHRSMMRKKNDTCFENNKAMLDADALKRRDIERRELKEFFITRGLDRKARRQRQPILKLVEDCGSELLMPKKRS